MANTRKMGVTSEVRNHDKAVPSGVISRMAGGPHNRSNPIASMTYEELLGVLRIAKERRTRDWCMLLFAYRHGLRTTEVCGLKLTDVQNGTLSVQRRKGSRKTVQPLCPNPSEPLLDEIKALQAWLKLRPNDKSSALFTSQKGGPLDRSQFFRIFQSAAIAAGLSAGKRHPRILKYSLAAHLLAGNASVNIVSEILGHRSLSSTLQYMKEASGAQGELLASRLYALS